MELKIATIVAVSLLLGGNTVVYEGVITGISPTLIEAIIPFGTSSVEVPARVSCFLNGGLRLDSQTDVLFRPATKLTAPEVSTLSSYHYYGRSVAIWGDTIVMGEIGYENIVLGRVGRAWIHSTDEGEPRLVSSFIPRGTT